jgi:SpoIIAA-like
MIEFMPESKGSLVGVRAGGKLTDADYKEVLIPRLETLFHQHGKLRVLIFMDETFEGWDLKAAWDDASLGLSHRTDFEKIAVVGPPAWVEWCIKVSGFLMRGEIRTFHSDQLAAAWEWIQSNGRSSGPN